jgi:hypothetical protein
MSEMNVEYGMAVVDKNNHPLGMVDHVVMDAWSGEPRKYIIRLEDDTRALYFKPENVKEVSGNKVKLKLALEEMERT